MTNNATKTYLVSVIERTIAYYKAEAGDARTAAENWQEGEFYARDDEALDTEGPCNVRERQHDGTWRKLPKSEWEAEPAAGTVTSVEGKTTPGSGGLAGHCGGHGMAIIQDAYGNIVTNCDSPDLPPGWHRPNARRIEAGSQRLQGDRHRGPGIRRHCRIAFEAMESLEEWADRYGLKATDPRDQAAVDELLDRASVVLDSATPCTRGTAFTKAKATRYPPSADGPGRSPRRIRRGHRDAMRLGHRYRRLGPDPDRGQRLSPFGDCPG